MKSCSSKFKISFKFLVVVLGFVFFFLNSAGEAKAASASLYLTPSTGTYTVGNTFSVQVKINSGEAAVNAGDGTLVFNPDKLEVKNISKTNSVFSLWVQEPVFSNSVGTINFAGGKPSPGFSGAAGTVITITFKAKTSGKADLTFASGSILADDGKGTNILTHMGSGSYNLTTKEIAPLLPEEEEEYIPPVSLDQPPLAPVVSSQTHPDEDKWYSGNSPEFSWKLPSDVSGVSLLLHQKPAANPGPASDGLPETKKFEAVEDGIWYFHIKFKNQYGWGSITHRKVMIDTQSPEPFKIIVDKKGELTNPGPILYFDTTDALSGMAYYEVIINSAESELKSVSDLKQNPFQMPSQIPGKHSVEVKAFDEAGNFTLSSTELEISPIKPPKITKIPISIRIGENLDIEGEALPEITVRIYIQKTGEEEPLLEKTQADLEGKFSLSYAKLLERGDYLVWVQSEDKRGAVSYPSEKKAVEVGLPPFLKFGKVAIDYLTTMITLIILIVGAAAVLIYTWYRVSLWRKRVRKETKEVSQSVSGAFRALREEVEEQIAMLDKKPGLTKGEKETRDKLQEALNVSERFIEKEIKDVEKELD